MASLFNASRERAAIVVALVPVVAYWPLVAFPYLLMDDNWLVRPSDPGYPSRGFIALVQGRPVLAAFSKGGELLFSEFGMTSIGLLRALGIACLMIGGVVLFHVLRTKGHLPVTLAVLSSSVFLAMPSMQVYAANGSWVLPGFVTAMLGVWALLSDEPRIRLLAGGTLTLVSLAIYQSFGFAMLALLLCVLALRGSTALQASWRAIVVWLCSLIAYYLTWTVAFRAFAMGINEDRYNPQALTDITKLSERVGTVVAERLPMITGVLTVPNTNGAWVRPLVVIFTLCLLVLLVLQGIHHVLRRRVTSRSFWGAAISVLAGVCALAAGEIPVWLSSAWPSYTTMIGLSLSWVVILAGLARLALPRCWTLDQLGWGTAALVSISTIAASYSVVTSFSIPLWVQQQRLLEYAADRLEATDPNGLGTKAFCIISDIGPGSDPLYGVAEFTWTNAQPFYSYWNVRTLLRLMGGDDGLITEVLASPSGIVLSRVGDDESAARACEGEEFLDLSNPSKLDLSSVPVYIQGSLRQGP